LELLLASPRGARYGGTAGGKSSYSVTQEVTDACVEGDMLTCMAIIETLGHPYRSGFMVASANLATGDFIPAHIGSHGRVVIDPTGTDTFKGGILAASMDELVEALHNPVLYPNAKRFYFIEDNCIEHLGSAAKVYYPLFTKTTRPCKRMNSTRPPTSRTP
jgi:hypothetical protein